MTRPPLHRLLQLLTALALLLGTATAASAQDTDSAAGFGGGMAPPVDAPTPDPEPRPDPPPGPPSPPPAEPIASPVPTRRLDLAPRKSDDVFFDFSRVAVVRVAFSRYSPEDEDAEALWNFRVSLFDGMLPVLGHPEQGWTLQVVGKVVEGELVDFPDGDAEAFDLLEAGLRYDTTWFGVQASAHVLSYRVDLLHVLTPSVAARVGSPRWAVVSAQADLYGLHAATGDVDLGQRLLDNLQLELNIRVPLTRWLQLHTLARYRDLFGGPNAPRVTDETYALGVDIAPAVDAGVRVAPVFVGFGLRHVIADTGTRIDGYSVAARWQQEDQVMLMIDAHLGPVGYDALW